MAFTQQHQYLTVHGTSVGDEEFQFGLRFPRTSAPSQTDVDTCAAGVAGWFDDTLSEFSGQFHVYRVKVATVGTDGRYPAGSTPVISEITPPRAGAGGGGGSRFPLQTAMVATLRTETLRGKAAKGRIYLPQPTSALGTTFELDPTKRANYASQVAFLLRTLNAAMGIPAAVMSFSGVTHEIVSVSIGSRLDVQRRRAKQQPETYSTVVL